MSDFDEEKYASAIKCFIPNNVKLEKEALTSLSSILREIHMGLASAIINNSKNMSEIDAKTAQSSIQPFIPENLRRYVFANASRIITLYKSELIACKDDVASDQPVVTDYKNGIKRILQDFDSTAARGFMPHINKYLNDVCYALAEKSSHHAQNNGGVLTANNVLTAVDEMLPNDLKQHAFARISHLQRRSILPPTKLSGTEPPAVKKLLTSDQNGSADTEEVVNESPTSVMDMARQLFIPAEERNETTETETKEQRKKKSCLDILRQ